MKITNLGTRGIMITYDDLVDTEYMCTSNIYIVKGETENVVIDTFLGPKIMKATLEKLGLSSDSFKKVINTHSDWDHIWGNSAFSKADIIGHTKLRKSVQESAKKDLEELEMYASGEIILKPPTITFDTKLNLPDLELELFSTPGHTEDSISIYDARDKILITGDNCEDPIPSFIDPFLLEEHLNSLQSYLAYDFEYIIPGHGEKMTRAELMLNIEYINDLIHYEDRDLKKYDTGKTKLNHNVNMTYLWE